MMGGIGQMLFGIIFNFALMMLFAPKPKDTITYGPRLDNLKPAVKDIQGQVINLTYGTTRISGTVFWASEIRETAHSDTTEHSSKGGGGDYTETSVTYTYDCDVAVGICEGPIVGIRRIWANKDLIYDVDQKPSALSWLKYSLFYGTETQEPSTLMQAAIGYENVSAHKGLAYIVFEQFQLDPFGRRLPQSFEFEVVAKGTVGGTAKRYTQVSSLLYGDVGNFYYSYAYPAGFSNSAYKFSILQWDINNYIIPVNNDNGLLYVKLNAATGTVDRYHVDPGYFTCPGDYYTGGTLYWGDWGAGTTGFAFFKVSFMGTGFKYVPCMIVNSGVSFSSGNSVAAFFVVNLVNNRVIATTVMPNCMAIGSFNQFHWSGVYNNSITAQQYTDGNGRVYTAEIKDHYAITATSAEQVDEYGMIKGTERNCLRYNEEYLGSIPNQLVSINGVNWNSSYHIHLVMFPDYYIDTRDYGDCTDPVGISDTYTISTNSYSILDTHIDYTAGAGNRNAIYEDYTYSVVDEFEQDKTCSVKVQKNTNVKTYRCYDNSLINDTTTSTSIWYPATLGSVVNSYDTDPLPPDQGVPYDKHVTLVVKRSVFVHYIDYSGYAPSSTDYPIVHKWIKFKNGDELLGLQWRSGGNYTYGVFRKQQYSAYNTSNTNVDPLENAFGYYFYQQYAGPTSKRITVTPNKYYTTEDYKPNQSFVWNSSPTFDLNNSNVRINNESPFSLVYLGNTMPYTSYWSRGMKKIYYMYGNTIYYYDLIKNNFVADFTTTVTCNNIMPFGGDYIGTNISGGLYGGENANIYYLYRTISTQPALLGEIINDLSTKAGIDLSVLDISTAAYNTEVFGFNVSDDIKLIDALESLLMHYFIDAFESEWKIKFRTRKEYTDSNINIKVIDTNELGVKELGENYNEKYKIIVREDTDLPQSINYAYIAAESGFIQANVTAIRNVDFNLGIKMSVKCPMALKTTEAYNNAFRILFDLWRATKEIEFRLPKTYAYLEPGDLVLLPIGASENSGEYIIVKITEVVAESHSYLEFKSVEEDSRNLEGIINDGAYEPKISTLITLATSDGILLDTYPLYNKYNNIDYTKPGIYCTSYGSNLSWRGGTIYLSYDDGLSFYNVSSFGPYSAPYGEVINRTNYTVDKHYTDNINTITLQTRGIQEFYSVSDDDYYYREGNVIAVQKKASDTIEFIQYHSLARDITNPEIITLSKLNRGLYNTNHLNSISLGDKVTLLPLGTKKIDISSEYYNKSVQYKYVSYNQYVDDADEKLFTYKCNWYKPYNVANFKSELSGSDIKISWNSRERNKPSYLFNNPDIIDTKEYTLKIYDSSNVLKRTVTSILADSYTYTSANLIADGFTTNSYIKFTLQRKATFLEYTHDIIDQNVYIGDEIQYLQALSNNNLQLYYKTNNANGLIITPTYGANGFQTLTYNNYNGKGYVNSDNCFYSTSAIKPLKNDIITCTSSNASNQHTTAFWIKIKYTAVDWVDNLIANINTGGGPGQWDGGFSIILKIGAYNLEIEHRGNGGCYGNRALYLPSDDWIFLAFSHNFTASGRPASYYARAPSGSYYAYYSYNSNNGCWGASNIYGNHELFKKASNNGVLDYTIQDFIILSTDLYTAAGNNFTLFENLYNMGLKKWQRQ